ncbi:ice-binding family protein [Hymenobacter rubripertinctus]|uniref:DUF3494 domain-containing protein n=1 Tax=Hymenobacter rubripertinctus TaxID=2029981 RepID=A0A418R510_9BACT|nr:ice-binding family protein [Hymenobacter rubripertinctus]RIY12419.1 DUF3494 domain-containing protein [Hymenobacter rubripertinctus]
MKTLYSVNRALAKGGVLLAACLLLGSPASVAQVAPDLGAANSFALFTAVGAFNNVGPTVIQGDIGTNAGAFSGFPLGVVTGNIHVADATSTQAATDVQTAFGYMSTIPCVTPLAVYGGTPAQTLIPGSYCVGAATTLAGTLILDGGGDPNAKFFLRVSGALTTAANSVVLTQNGATPGNVYWQIGGLVTLGQNSVMRGTLLVDGAINMIQGASLIGRGLSRGGAVTIDTNTASLPGAVVTGTFWLGNPLGTGTTDWFTPGNWSNGVPTSLLDATVPANTAPYPVIASGNALANGLTLGTGARLTMNGGTLDLKASLSNSGTFSATAGTTTLSGTSPQVVGGSGSTQFWSLRIANTAGAFQTSAVSVHGVLAPASGDLNTNGQTLTLLSDATGTAMVVDNGTGTINGNATMQRYIDPSLNAGLGYRHYSSPVQATTINDLATAGFTPVINPAYNTAANPGSTTPFPTVYGYDEARLTSANALTSDFNFGYFSPAALTNTLVPGRGYTVNLAASETVDLTGTLSTGTVPVGALSRGQQANAGWQLLGNPYPAPLDWNVARTGLPTGVIDAIYTHKSSSQYAGTYQFYQNGFGTLPGGLIPAMQGFFLRVSQNVPSFSFQNSWRVTSYQNPTFNRGAADTRPAVQLDLVDAQGTHEPTFVYFEAGATTGRDDHYDAEKLPNTTGLNLASIAATGEALAVNGLPVLSSAAVIVPLTVDVPQAGRFAISAPSLANLPTSTLVELVDNLTGTRHDLRQLSAAGYAFSTDSRRVAGRFVLNLRPNAVLASGSAALAAQVRAYPNPAQGQLTISRPAGAAASAVLLNGIGQQLRTLALPTTETTLNLQGLPSGVYALRVTLAGGQTVVQRVVVQ